MPVVRENLSTGTNAAATNQTLSFGFTATAGRLLVLIAGNTGGSVTFSGLSSGWQLIHDNTDKSRNQSAFFAYKVAVGGETSVSVTLSTSTTIDFIVAEYSGLDTSAPLDQSAENDAQNTTAATSCATGTTATLAVSDGYAISVWIGDATTWPGGSRTYLNGSTEVSVNTSGNCGLVMAQKQLSASTGFSETIQNTANDQCYGSVAVFKQATGSSAPTLTAASAINIGTTTATAQLTFSR